MYIYKIKYHYFPHPIGWKIEQLAEITQLKVKVKVKSLSSVRLCDPMDCSPLGSSVHAIFQARVLEWVAIARWC